MCHVASLLSCCVYDNIVKIVSFANFFLLLVVLHTDQALELHTEQHTGMLQPECVALAILDIQTADVS